MVTAERVAISHFETTSSWSHSSLASILTRVQRAVLHIEKLIFIGDPFFAWFSFAYKVAEVLTSISSLRKICACIMVIINDIQFFLRRRVL
jgi:hypothetical protein